MEICLRDIPTNIHDNFIYQTSTTKNANSLLLKKANKAFLNKSKYEEGKLFFHS